jgi:twitching motility two-component system response regulator PilH
MNRVLIVEDSQTQALRFQLELLRYGLSVEVATNGRSGLDTAYRTLPDVIVLDVDLPGMDGYQICRNLKADPQTQHIPVLMLTRREEAHDALIGIQAGANDYIPKDSFAEHNLVEALRQLGVL